MNALIVITLIAGLFAVVALIDELLDKHERKVKDVDE